MKLAFWIARRYIFSKKSTNAINIISAISVFGIALGSMALVVIMSVFNGFEDVLRDLIGSFKPDIQVTVREGKTFVLDSTKLVQIRAVEGVSFVSAGGVASCAKLNVLVTVNAHRLNKVLSVVIAESFVLGLAIFACDQNKQ